MLNSSQLWICRRSSTSSVTADHVAAQEIALWGTISALCLEEFWTPPWAILIGAIFRNALWAVLLLIIVGLERAFSLHSSCSLLLRRSTLSRICRLLVAESLLRSLISAAFRDSSMMASEIMHFRPLLRGALGPFSLSSIALERWDGGQNSRIMH